MALRDTWGYGWANDDLEDAVPTWAHAQKKSLRATEQTRADVAEARRLWQELQPKLDVTKLVFLDETWAKTNMTRLYGRSPRGQRLIGTAPYGHWKTTTFLAGLRHDGIIAPLVLDGPINGPAFLAWVEPFLAPTLQPGQIVIADRLGRHKSEAVRAAIEARGASLMRVPAYSHDFNPRDRATPQEPSRQPVVRRSLKPETFHPYRTYPNRC